jgi:pilus assembly protein Flp/PilA
VGIGAFSRATQRGTFNMLTSFEMLAGWLRAKFGDDERGASLVEYALLVALIAVVCIIAITFLGQQANDKFSSAGSSVN